MDKTQWLALLKVLGPVVGALVPGLDPTFVPLIVTGVAEAEQIRGADGPTKKAHVVELVKVAAAAANAGTKKNLVDVAGIAQAASIGIDAIVRTTNAAAEQPVALKAPPVQP